MKKVNLYYRMSIIHLIAFFMLVKIIFNEKYGSYKKNRDI